MVHRTFAVEFRVIFATPAVAAWTAKQTTRTTLESRVPLYHCQLEENMKGIHAMSPPARYRHEMDTR